MTYVWSEKDSASSTLYSHKQILAADEPHVRYITLDPCGQTHVGRLIRLKRCPGVKVASHQHWINRECFQELFELIQESTEFTNYFAEGKVDRNQQRVPILNGHKEATPKHQTTGSSDFAYQYRR
ncbi:hypothetical protein M0804_014591 [Polistes exclamans]|nr:hypothetical protein M0804_014591 [Polistes exclamans]